jgi:hypothetical protein
MAYFPFTTDGVSDTVTRKKLICVPNQFNKVIRFEGKRDSVVVEALYYKPEGRGIASR